MLTAPVLLSAIPESYNSTRLIFSSVYSVSDSGINFNVYRSPYNNVYQGLYGTFDSFVNSLTGVAGVVKTRDITSEELSPAHIKWFKDNTFEILDTNFGMLDIQTAEEYSKFKNLYKVLVTSSVGAVVADSAISNGLSADTFTIPLMYDKNYRTSVTDWVTVPLVSGRKVIYVATSGSDSNDGLAESTPKLTVSAAYGILNPGDHLLFRRGNVWTNQAFGGTADGLPANLCADGKSGSSLTCPTYVGAWGPETDALPLFNITTSTITTFFLADNEDEFSGLRNFYVKCLHLSGGGRNVTEEQNGDQYPSFFTLLNTGASDVATGLSGPATSDNILIEGCTLTEVGNAITIAAYYNSLVRGNNNDYGWGTANFVSSYNEPAAVTNILIRRNIFKDLYYVPADSFSRSGGLSQYLSDIFNYRNSAGAYEYRSQSEPNSLAKYHLRFAALIASLNKGQPKAIFIQGASGQGNTVEGNIFYRCGNKSETYPETYDRSHLAVVHAEGGYAGINVFRNIFYKSGGTAVKQLDGGSNINNIYYRNPESIVMMGDVGLFEKSVYQGVPTSGTFPAVSGGYDIRYSEGNFVPYWYWFNKNTGLSIIKNNVIEEPQDIGYNIKNVSGDNVTYDRTLPEQTAESKSNAIVVLGGTVSVKDNYIGNISKGICTGKTSVILGGYGRQLSHWNRGANSILHSNLSSLHEWQNKVIFQGNVINNHGALQLELHNWPSGRFNPMEAPTYYNLFDASCLKIVGNVFRNNFWNNRAKIVKDRQLSEPGVNLFRLYSDAVNYGSTNGALTSRIVFQNNKLSFNPGQNSQRGFELIGRFGFGQPNGEISYATASSIIPALFGNDLTERRNTVASNPMYGMNALRSIEGESNFSWLEGYVPKSVSLENDGWTKYEPYNYGQPGGTRIFYVDPIAGNDSNNGLHPTTPFRNLKTAIHLLEDNRPDWILLKRGRTFNFDEVEINGVVSTGGPGPNRRHTTEYAGGGNQADPGILLVKNGLSEQYPIIIGAYGSDANPLTGNYFGAATESRPFLTRSLSGPAEGFPRVGGFFRLHGKATLTADTPTNQTLNQQNWYARYITFLDLHLAGIDYGPNGAEPANAFCRYEAQKDISTGTAFPMFEFNSTNGSVSGIRFEGLLCENWFTEFVGAIDPFQTSVRPGIVPYSKDWYGKNIVWHRCAFYKNYQWDSQSGGSRTSIMYLGYLSGVSAIECTMDSAGKRWETAPWLPPRGTPAPSTWNGQPSIFSHTFYWSENLWKGYVDSCIFARSSSHGIQFRTGGEAHRNVFLKVPFPILLNACNSQQTNCDTLRFTRVGSKAISNLIWNSDDMGGIAGGNGGWAIEGHSGSSITIDDNIIMKQGGDFAGGEGQAIQLGKFWNQGNMVLPVSDVSVTNNVIYNWLPPGTVYPMVALFFADAFVSRNILIQGNKFWAENPNRLRALQIVNGWTGAPDAPIISRENNFGNNNSVYCANVTGCTNNQSTISTSSFVTSRWLDNTSIFNNTHDFPDPDRGVTSYLEEVATEALPADKLNYFMTKARMNRKGFWDQRWTAESFNNYVREGFGKPPVSRHIGGIEDFLTHAMENLSCGNNSLNFKLMPQNIINSNITQLLQVTPISVGGGAPTGDVLPAVNPTFIDSLNGNSILTGQTTGYSLNLRNTTSLRQTFTYTNDQDQVVQVSIGPRKTIKVDASQVSDSLLNLISNKVLFGVLEQKIGGETQKIVVNDPLDVPPVSETIEETREAIDDVKSFIQSLLTTYSIQATYEDLVYGKPMTEFYSTDAVEETPVTPAKQFLDLAFPVIQNRKDTIKVVADFMRYCIGVLDSEIKILNSNTAKSAIFSVDGTEESLDQLIARYSARVLSMRNDLRVYLDAALQGSRTVDSVFIELGVESF